MEITKKESKDLAKLYSKAIEVEKGERVYIVYSKELDSYLVVIKKENSIDYIDSFSTRIYSKEEVGEVKEVE